MTPLPDPKLLRAVYRHLNFDALLRENPELKRDDVVAFFRRVDALLGGPVMPASSEPSCSPAPARKPGEALDRAMLHTDGGSRGNPGIAGYGAVLLDACGRTVAETSRCIGTATCNEAEYQGLIAGLDLALTHGVRHIEIRSDSQLLVRQLNGEYKVKSPKLMSLFLHARRTLNSFASWRAEHVPRAQNARADELANEAMDKRNGN